MAWVAGPYRVMPLGQARLPLILHRLTRRSLLREILPPTRPHELDPKPSAQSLVRLPRLLPPKAEPSPNRTSLQVA